MLRTRRSALIEDRFARLDLIIEKVERLPSGSRPIAKLLQDWGLGNQPQECFWVIAVDLNGNIRTAIEVGRGGEGEQVVHVPAVLTAVLAVGASTFTVAHNHPALTVLPSRADVALTNALVTAANACGLSLEEHIIVGPTAEYYSFVDGGLLIPVPRSVDRVARKAANR